MNKELSPNTTLSHYRIVSKIGAGGMGEVYLAQDTKLDRKVALKILPADVASNRDRMERFVREAKSAAALNHPHIAHVYEIGESDGTHFIAMEFIDGETLREKIHKEKAPLSKLLKYLIQVAEGLSKAHAAGIVHRDLKPDNIMITRDDYAKVLDFGLAKLVEPQRTFESGQVGSSEIATAIMQQQSIPGMVMGTIGYMSPEQASGRVNEIDHRSDIFSFGCMLFEAATGQKAFEGKDALDSLHKIVHAPTPRLKDANPLAPDDLQRIVRRCLAKEPEKRYQSIKELALEIDDLQQELKGLAGAEYSSSAASSTMVTTSGAARADEGFWVAVLPFKYQGSNVDLAALAEGLSEDIVTGLSRFSYLRVIARSSALRFNSEAGDIRTIGKELGARYVMEGSLRQAGSVLRVSVQLVDASTGAHLWAETYDRPFRAEDIFVLQDDLVPRIVSTVADWYGVLPHSMSEAVLGKTADQMSPYEAVLRGFGYYERVTADEHAAARTGLERAVQQAPGYADAWVMLSMMYGEEHRFRFNVKPDPLGRALQAARRAVDLAPSNHLAHLALAQALFFRKDYPAFRSVAERAIALNPMDGSTGAYIGHLMAFAGDWERGCDVFDRARELNPHHPEWYWALPFHDAYRQGDDRRALTFAPKISNAGNSLTHAMRAALYGQLGELKEAGEALRELALLAPDFALNGREELDKWYPPELVERLIDGLRKAGLAIPADPGSAASSGAFHAPSPASGETRADEGFWVAVLTFKVMGSSTELETMASGMTEEIVTGLSRFSYLRVIARGSTLKHSQSGDVREIGKELGARYVMEGSIRQAGATVRVAVQLVDATTGAHVWAETYDRHFQPDQVFAMQDELIPRIVSTCGDAFGVLARSISDVVRGKKSSQLSPYEALMRGFGYHHRLTPVEHAEAREALERAVEQAPANADCLAMLSWIYSHEHAHGFNARPGSLGRALAAARRAVDIAPSNHLAHQALAVVLFFRKETAACLSAAERALALNPLDASNEAIFLITFTGDWERGCALIRRAMELNPHHPGWYRLVLAFNEYRMANYRAAVDEAVKANVPGIFWTNVTLSAAHGQLGELEAAGNALRALLAQKEDFVESARELIGKWFDAELGEHLIEGMRKAGLEIEIDASRPNPASARADEGFWVAVLPFKYRGENADLAALADGLSEEIVTGFSRFSYLRVIARTSTLRFSSEATNIRSVGNELGARYVMEGSLRQAGAVLRVAVKLVDASTGAHLWAENYERSFSPEAVFELQDDLVPRIVSTVADMNGVLPRSMSEAVRSRPPEQLSPYEAVLRSFGYFERVTGEELADARSCLELAVKKAPAYADAWAMLALLCVQDYGQGFNLHADALTIGVSAARHAVEAGPSNHLAYFSLAQALFFQKEIQSFRNAAERAAALNPMDGNSIAFLGELLTSAGDTELGLKLAGRAKQLNPHHPGWYWYADFFNAYRQGDYRGARSFALKFNLPNHWGAHMGMAVVCGQLGEREAAGKALGELLKLRPDVAATVRKDLEKWFDPEFGEHLIDGLRKAGLDIADEGRHGIERERGGDDGSEGEGETTPKFVGHSASIAVLPFVNISNDTDNEYFCDGLAEELLNALSKIEALHVAARTSAFSFKGKETDIREIGQKLNVGAVLEGSVRKAGNRLRIAAQLVNVADGYHLWSESYDRQMEDIFDIQGEISLAIVDALKVKLLGAEKAAVLKRHTDNAEAYQLYLKGRFFVNQRTSESLRKAIECFNQAISVDANYALGYAGLADAYLVLGVPDAVTEALAPQDSLPKARAAAEKALQIDNLVAEVYPSLAHVKWKERDWAGAACDYDRGLKLNPNYPIAHFYYAVYLASLGRQDEAVKEIRRAQELDPLSLPINASVTYVFYLGRQYYEAIEAGKKTLELDATFPLAHQRLGLAYVQKQMYREAIAEFQQAANNSNRAPQAIISLGHAYAVSGNKVEAQKVLAELKELSQGHYVSPYGVAIIYVGLGDKEQAFQWLEKANNERNTELTFLKVDPRLDPLRDDPRFQALLKKVGFPAVTTKL